MKVLICDDELFARTTLSRMLLDKPNVEILEAADSYDAYKLYEEHHPEIVIADIVMKGGIGGEWLIEKLLNLDRRCNIIVISGRPQSELLKYKLMGAKYCLHKPVKYTELWECIDTILQR